MDIDKETIIKYFDIVLLSEKKDNFFDIYDSLVPKYLTVNSSRQKKYFNELKSEIIAFAEYEKYFKQFDNGSCKLTDIGKTAKKKGGHFKYLEFIENKELDSNKTITNNFNNSTINQFNQDSNFSNSPTSINPTEPQEKKSLIVKFWKLITENKLISGIILVIISEEITIGKIWEFIYELFYN